MGRKWIKRKKGELFSQGNDRKEDRIGFTTKTTERSENVWWWKAWGARWLSLTLLVSAWVSYQALCSVQSTWILFLPLLLPLPLHINKQTLKGWILCPGELVICSSYLVCKVASNTKLENVESMPQGKHRIRFLQTLVKAFSTRQYRI